MKNFTLLIFSLATLCPLFAQKQATLSSNNMEALIANKMALFGDAYDNVITFPNTQFAKFYAPKNQETSPMYAGNLWITGTNEDSTQIYSSSETYHGYPQSEESFWATGPISDDTSAAYYYTYNRVWSITKQQIEDHISSYDNILYSMPEVIRNWPANGNIEKGEAKTLAPYVDVNKNEVYDPQNGDYPIIVGNHAILSIFNDSKNPDGFGIEVYRTMYTYDNFESIFANYTIKNRLNNTYHNVKLSTWNDFELGNPQDDYCGSVPVKNAILVYNGDYNDEIGPQGTAGYGYNPPAFGIKFLNTYSSASMYYAFGWHPTLGEPVEPEHFFNYSNARLKDGSSLQYNNNRIYHMFSGHPADTVWSEITAGNQPGARRMVMSSEKYTLAPQETICIDLAYCYGRYDGNTPYDYAGYDALLNELDSTQAFYDNTINTCNSINTFDSLLIKASDYFLCINGDVNFSIDGFNFSSEIINWEFPGATPSTHTGLTAPNINYSAPGYYDVTCTINFLNGDSLVLHQPKLIQVKEQTQSPLVEGIEISFNDSCSLTGFTLSPINASHYGLSALFEYSTRELGIFASSYSGPVTSNAPIQNGDTLVLTITSKDDCLITQTVSTSKIVTLAQPDFTTTHHPSNLLEVHTDVETVEYQWYYIKPNGDWVLLNNKTNSTYQALGNGQFIVTIDFGGGCILQSEIFVVTTVGIYENTLEYNLSISPNPSNGQNIKVHIASANQEMLNITIFNSIGKAVLTTSHQATNIFEINTHNLPSGQYHIQFESEQERTIKPLIIL